MSFSSYISCGLSASMCSDDESESSSHFSIMDFFQDFPLCCQDTESVEAIFRPPALPEDSDREGITRANRIMEKPWRPPRYRDLSLLVAPFDAEEENQSPSSSPKTITPSIGVVSPCDDSIPSRSVVKNNDDIPLPPDFIPPKTHLSRPRSFEVEVFGQPNKENYPNNDEKNDISLSSKSQSSAASATTSMRLEPKDVVCGRGAPTSIHPGNLVFKKVIKKHEMKYLCSTRSEKPKIAMKLLEEFRTRGVRFVKRERAEDDRFEWIEIGEQRSYEKICQSLREGAPKLRRQMMATEAKQAKTKNEKQNRQLHFHPQTRQQRQDNDTGFFDETKRVVCDVSQTNSSSSSSTVKTSNERFHYDPIGEQNHRNIEWLYYQQEQYPVHKGHIYDTGRHCDIPYYVHLPPHLGGERLFRDRM